MAARVITVSHETIRAWVSRFGVRLVANVRLRSATSGRKWPLDEAVVKKNWLWRAVGANGDVLDFWVQPSRNKAVALRFFRKLFKTWGWP